MAERKRACWSAQGVSAFPIVLSFFRFTSDDKQPHDAMPKRHEKRTSDGKSHGVQDGHTGKLEETTTENTQKAKRDSV